MVGTNSTNVQKALDGIRERRQKFICLNDNMNHSDPEAANVKIFFLHLCLADLFFQTVRVLKEFYDALFPLPSSFELPANESNKYLYIGEMKKL